MGEIAFQGLSLQSLENKVFRKGILKFESANFDFSVPLQIVYSADLFLHVTF